MQYAIGLVWLLAFQMLGELISRSFPFPIPGPVWGMAALFVFLLLRGAPPSSMSLVADGILKQMSLLFIPAGAGLLMLMPLLQRDFLPILVAMVVSTFLGLLVTGLVMRALENRDA